MSNAFPLRAGDKIVRALIEAGTSQLADVLSYELNALEGNHLCGHFNQAAGVPAERRAEIDQNRRLTAQGRIETLKQSARDILGYDPEERDDHDGGGQPVLKPLPPHL